MSPGTPIYDSIHLDTLYPCIPPGCTNEFILPNANPSVTDSQYITAIHPRNHFHTVKLYAFISFVPAISSTTTMRYAGSPKHPFIRNSASLAPAGPVWFCTTSVSPVGLYPVTLWSAPPADRKEVNARNMYTPNIRHISPPMKCPVSPFRADFIFSGFPLSFFLFLFLSSFLVAISFVNLLSLQGFCYANI